MRAVIEKDVLEDCFNGASSEVLIAAHASVLGVTEAIVEEYMNITDPVSYTHLDVYKRQS